MLLKTLFLSKPTKAAVEFPQKTVRYFSITVPERFVIQQGAEAIIYLT